MIERTERDLDSSPNVSPPTRTAPASSSAGSSAPASGGRKSLSGTRVLVTTAPSRVPTSRSIRSAMSMSVPRATCSRPPAASAPTCPAYLALKRDCGPPLKPRCCPKTPSRKVTRDVNEDARDQARSQMGTPELQEGRDAFCPPEDASPLRADAPSGPVRRTRHAIVQNLKTLASRIWRPPLTAAIGGHFCE